VHAQHILKNGDNEREHDSRPQEDVNRYLRKAHQRAEENEGQENQANNGAQNSPEKKIASDSA
jgi:hypothetical protein